MVFMCFAVSELISGINSDQKFGRDSATVFFTNKRAVTSSIMLTSQNIFIACTDFNDRLF